MIGGALKIVVAGAHWGELWVRAMMAAGHEVVALLSRGSARSKQLGEALGVAVHVAVDDLPPFDVACVAVGQPAGLDLALRLMERGADVVVEHPLAADAVEALYTGAHATGRRARVHAHFPLLEAPRSFLDEAAGLRAAAPPLWVQVGTNQRTLFGACAVVEKLVGPLETCVRRISKPDASSLRDPVVVVDLLVGSTPVQLVLWNVRDVHDRGLDSMLNLSLRCEYAFGVLTMPDVVGPVSWRRYPGAADRVASRPDLPAAVRDQLGSSVTSAVVHHHEVPPFSFLASRIHAMQREVELLAGGADDRASVAWVAALCDQLGGLEGSGCADYEQVLAG